MKQTNNAIKFLMAQYRAIFQNAYFKGLATAAVVTMGLAASQAQAKGADDAFTGAEEIPAGQTLIITGDSVDDPTTNLNQYKSFEIAADPTGTFAGNIKIQGGAKASNFIKGNAAIEFTANNLTIAAGDAGNGLTITGQSDSKSVDATFNEITITKGDLELVGNAAGKATLQANKISLSSDTANAALLTVGANTITGYDLTGKGAAKQDPVPGAAKDLANYTSLELGTNSKLASTASASDATVLNVGSLSINGGDLNVAKGATAATDALTVNLVQGELLNEGKITTVASGSVFVKFAEGDFIKDGTAVEKTFTLTKGTLDLTGGMTLSGDGTLVVTDKLDDLTVKGTTGITLTNKAAFAPKDVATAKAVAGKLPLNIGANGVLDFGSTAANLDDLTFHTAANASTSDTKIGLAATGVIKGDTLSLTKKLGTDGIVSGKTVNLGDSGAAQSDITVGKIHSSQTLNIGKDVKAKEIVLTAGDVAAINKAHENDAVEVKDNNIKAAALAESGSFGTVEGVTDGKLTIAETGKLDVVNGTWNTNGVDIVLGSGSTAGNLNVGATDPTLGTNKTAAKLVFGADSVLTLTKGTVTVGSTSNANLLGAELDISALQDGGLDVGSGAISVESGGTILANSVLIDTLVDSSKDLKVTISSGGVLDIAEGLEIDADTLAVAAGKGKLAFTGKTGDGLQATLKSDSVTINKATGTSVNIGEFGVIEANTLTLNNDNAGTLEDVTLDEGKFVVKQSLTSDGSGLKATLAKANTTLELGKIVKNNGENELASASGSSTLGLELGNATAALKVVGGQWGLQDVTVTDGTVKVGNDDPVYDANDKLISAQVSGGKLTQSAGTVTINEGSSATFNELFTTTGTTTVKGVLAVVGKHNAAVTTPTPAKANFGASINNEVAVTGANAKLVIGTTALGSIKSYKADGAGIEYTADVDPLFGTGGKATLTQFGTLELQFAEGTKFSLNDLASLRKGVTDSGTALEAGFISIGNASLTDSVVSGGTITAENLNKIKDFKDIVIQDIANATVTGVNSNTVVTGNVGNIKADANVSKVNIGQATLNKANKDGQFAVDANGKQVDLAVSKEGGYLHLVNDGEAKNITLANGVSETQKTNLVVKGKADGKTTINSVKADKSNVNTNFEVASGNVKVTQGVQVGTLNTAKDTTLTAESLNITASAVGTNYTSEIWGTVNVDKNATFADDLSVGGKLAVSGDLAANGKETYVAKDGQLTVDGMLTLGASSTLHVGLEDEKDAQGNVIESGSTGYLFAKTLNLNGQTLFVDPEFTDKTSIAAVKNFGDEKNNQTDAGVINGTVVVGKNAALMAGQDATIAAMQDYISQYQQNGSLVKGQVENIVYLADKVTLENNSKIILDSQRSSDQIKAEIKNGATGVYAAQFSGTGSKVEADLYLGSNSVLTVSDNILGKNQGVAIHFNKDDAAILGASGSKIVLDGESFLNSRKFNLFTDKGTGAGNDTGVKVLGTNNITVESLNGLLVDYLEAGKEAGAVELSLNKKELDSKLLGASAPMRDFLIGFADRKVNWEEVLNAPNTPVIDLVDYKADETEAKWEGNKIVVVDNNTGLTANDYVAIKETVGGQETTVVYRKANNQFLEKVVRNTDGAAADQAARMGDFGGAAETALVATSTTYDAVAGRFGMGQQAGTMTIANNGQGSGLWVTPVYKSHESDGFDADGLGYGSDITLYGVALGGDVTLANGVRVGAMFNVGSGDADGQGAASVVSNDFDYFGGSIYAGYAIDNLSIVGDISYTTIDSDVEANTAAGKTSTSFDTSALSVGVTGQYALKVAEMDVTPHAGMRFTRIDMDDYTIDSADFGEVGQYNASSANVFSIPVGVTISKEYVTDTWTVKPSFDLTLTGNFGDDTVDGTVSWSGVSNWDVSTKAEFVDNFTYGASVGIAAKTGNFGLGLGLNYTGSSNTDEFGVNANARYMF